MRRLEPAFAAAAGELGQRSAAWLFVREVAAVEGDAGVVRLRDALGRAFPVLDAVARCWLESHGEEGAVEREALDPAAVLEVCRGATRLLVAGVEAAPLDALVPRLPDELRVGLVLHGPRDVDWGRVLGNWGGRVEGTDLADFQRWAGARSVLLTFAYGADGEMLHVPPTWARVQGPDVRASFRALVAWDVLGAPTYVYPRWLVLAPRDDFSHVLGEPLERRASVRLPAQPGPCRLEGDALRTDP